MSHCLTAPFTCFGRTYGAVWVCSARTAEVQQGALGRLGSAAAAGGAQHSQSNSRLTLMRIGALRVPSDDGRRFRRAEGLASGVTAKVALVASRVCGLAARASGRTAGASARRHRRCSRGAAARRPSYEHVTVRRARSSRRGHRLAVPSPSYCLPDGWDGARCTAPLHSACPPAAMPPTFGPLLTSRYTRTAPKNFPHRAGKIDCAASPE